MRFAVALLAIVVFPGWQVSPSAASSLGEQRSIVIEVFLREGSKQCDQMRELVADLQRRRQGLHVVFRDVARDASDLARLKQLTEHFGAGKPRVPTVYTTGRMLVGFRDAETTGRKIEDLLRVQIFTRDGCPRCALAMPYINGLARRYPGLSVEVYEVSRDPNARAWCEQLTRQHGIQAPGFPTFHLLGRLVVGYSGLETTGSEIETMLRDASTPAEQGGSTASPPTSLLDDPPRATSLAVLLTAMQVQRKDRTVAAIDSDRLPDEADLPAESESPGVLYGPGQGPTSRMPSPESIRVPMLGELHVRDLGMPLFTFLIGLIDGFNPCAMWVLVFLLSVLVNLHDRRRIALIAGTFVAVSGLAYYAFMAAWLNIFLLIGFARPAQVILGLVGVLIGALNVKDFFAFRRGVTLSIPEAARPGIYGRVRAIVAARNLTAALAGAVLLALLVNTVELLCTAGLPALYTQILTQRQYPAWLNYAYLALYNVAYMLDDAIVLTIVVATLSRRRLQEREGRWLKLVSGLVILALGLVMLFEPEWLV